MDNRTIKFRNPALVGNLSSGAQNDIQADILHCLKNHFPGFENTTFVEGADIERAIAQILEENPDILIVFGGDGTALTAARLASKQSIPILPLPGGTMNILHQKMYKSKNWVDILEGCLQTAKVQWHPAGFVNDDMFLVAAIIGTPARLATAREAARDKDVIGTAQGISSTLDAISDGDNFNLINPNGAPYKMNLVQVTCPGMNDYATQEDEFEIVAVQLENYRDLAGLSLRSLTSNWRDFDGAVNMFCKTISAEGKGMVDVLLDGELASMSFPLTLTLKPKAFKFLSL